MSDAANPYSNTTCAFVKLAHNAPVPVPWSELAELSRQAVVLESFVGVSPPWKPRSIFPDTRTPGGGGQISRASFTGNRRVQVLTGNRKLKDRGGEAAKIGQDPRNWIVDPGENTLNVKRRRAKFPPREAKRKEHASIIV